MEEKLVEEQNNSQQLLSQNEELSSQIVELKYYKEIYKTLTDENSELLKRVSLLEEKQRTAEKVNYVIPENYQKSAHHCPSKDCTGIGNKNPNLIKHRSLNSCPAENQENQSNYTIILIK